MNTLDRICADKRVHVEAQKQLISLENLKSKIKKISLSKGFIRQILDFKSSQKIPLITEVKKASPSKGIIREDFDPVEIAKTYEQSGAACLSVLTDEPYFQGKDEYFIAIRDAVSLPMLRKDFMIDPYQIYESRAMGADCILIIMAALSDSEAAELYDLSRTLGMDVLVEVHDEKELERAINLGPQMIGVNNRNLKTLEVDIENGIRMAKNIPDAVVKIGESGIYTADDLQQLKAAGFQGFLIGESLMRENDIGQAVKNLLK